MDNLLSECRDDNDDCNEFCFRFLNSLSPNVQKETSLWLHKLFNSGVGDEGAKECCTDLIMKIERELGPEHIVCELVMKIMAKRLVSIGLPDNAFTFVNEIMKRKKSEDVDSLLLLSHICMNTSKFEKAKKYMEKADIIAEESGEPLTLCLVLAKQICNMRHLKDDENEENLKLCEIILEEVVKAEKDVMLPYERNTERLIEVFKSLGYIYGYLLKRPRKSAQYYNRALEILQKDTKAVLRIFQVETRVIRLYSKYAQQKTCEYALNTFKKIKDVSRNETFMNHHSFLITHFLQELAYSLELANCNKDALELHTFAFEIGQRITGGSHPKVVRQAANMAYFCFRNKYFDKEAFYVNSVRTALESDAVDLSHAQELSDAWFTLGLLFSLKEDFMESEKCYKEAISLTLKAHGPFHYRLYRLYNKLGDLYKMNEKWDLSLDCYEKCKKIRDESNFDKTRNADPDSKISEILKLQERSNEL